MTTFPAMEVAPSTSEDFISTLYITNIHCPSCVSHARDILSPLSHLISQIDISLIDHTVRIRHHGNISQLLVQELVDASFEVEHVTLENTSGDVVTEFEVALPKAASIATFFNYWSLSKAQKQHIKNCNACQNQKRRNIIRKITWADILRERRVRKLPTIGDVEHGTEEQRDIDATPLTAPPLEGNSQDEPAGLYTADYSIEGMTCASCVSTISEVVQQLDFVQSVSINLLSSHAKVVLYGPPTKADEIKGVIEDIGYGANVEQINLSNVPSSGADTWKASLSISGMTCGSCVGNITQGLQDLSLVQSAHVDLLTNSASVHFHGKQELDTIMNKLDEIGYAAHVINVEKAASISQHPRLEARSVQIKLSGMYCPLCPENIVTAVLARFPGEVAINQHPTLKIPILTVSYQPSPPEMTLRQIIETMNNVDPACSASVHHPPNLEQRSRSIQLKERNRILRHLFLTFVIAVPSFIIGVVYMSIVPSDNQTRQWFEEPIWAGNSMRIDWALFIMTTPVMFYGANLFHTRALKEIWTLWRPRSKVPVGRRFYRFGSMNLLISAGTAVAYFASVAVLILDAKSTRSTHATGRKSSTYFDTVTFLTLFILLGRFLEAYSKAKTGDAVSMLANLRPTTALLVETKTTNDTMSDKGGVKQVPVGHLEVGDLVSIPHGSCPPMDGVVTNEGKFLFDESSLTGESRPVKKVKGDIVFAGTTNIGDPVQIQISKLAGKSMLDQIVSVVREGQTKRAPIERFADVLTGYFTPVITLLAILTWFTWLMLGELDALPEGWLDVDNGGWPYWSVEFAVAVFVVACPCGIGLAAPTALFVGGGLAAQHGILVQGGGEAFQEASRLNVVVFDKTGTLTEGRMQVTEVEFVRGNADVDKPLTYAISKALEEASTHPIAKAVTQYCDESTITDALPNVDCLGISEIPGEGMHGKFEVQIESSSRTYEAWIGNERLLARIVNEHNPKRDTNTAHISTTVESNKYLASALWRFRSLGYSTAILVIRAESTTKVVESSHIVVFGISDPVRSEAPGIIAALHSQGLEIHMCTGDNPQTAQSIGTLLRIPLTNIRAGVLPQDKATYVKSLQQAAGGRKIVAFVGDGTNDTPALTVADVSIAMSHPDGGGSDIALTSSSFVLMNSDLTSILTLVKLSRRVFRRVKLNFVWAAIYNVCLLPVAAGVFFPVGATWGDDAHGGFRLSPVWASVAMAGSSISVVLSSLALTLPDIELQRIRPWWRTDPID